MITLHHVKIILHSFISSIYIVLNNGTSCLTMGKQQQTNVEGGKEKRGIMSKSFEVKLRSVMCVLRIKL